MLTKNNFCIDFTPILALGGYLLDLLESLVAQMGPSIDFRTILGCSRGGFGRPWIPFGVPWGTEWRPERPKNRTNTGLCDHNVAKAGRVMKTGSPDLPDVVKT